MQKRFISYARKCGILLSFSLLTLVSCSGGRPFWLNEKQKAEFFAKVEAMTPDNDDVRFYSAKENNVGSDPFPDDANFDEYTSRKGKDGVISFRKSPEVESTKKQAKDGETAYDYALSCLEERGVKNAFSLIDVLPFVKEAAPLARDILNANDYPFYQFDVDATVFESFKSFRESHFNVLVNDSIDTLGKIYFQIEHDFKRVGLGLGSVSESNDKGTIISYI